MTGDGAEVLAHVVVARLVRLRAADLVGRSRHQNVLALMARIPAIGPTHPHKALAWRFDMGGLPSLASVCANLDLVDGWHPHHSRRNPGSCDRPETVSRCRRWAG